MSRTLVLAGKIGPAFSKHTLEIVETNVRQVYFNDTREDYAFITEESVDDSVVCRYFENGSACVTVGKGTPNAVACDILTGVIEGSFDHPC